MGQHGGSSGRHATRPAGRRVQGGLRSARADLPAPDAGAGAAVARRGRSLAAARCWHCRRAAGRQWSSAGCGTS